MWEHYIFSTLVMFNTGCATCCIRVGRSDGLLTQRPLYLIMWRLDEGSLALLAELDAMMLAHAWEIVQMGFDFGVEVLKGKTTQRLRGKIADAVRGSARTKDALTWCRSRGLHTSARYEIDHYGVDLCGIMARTWCKVMTHLYLGGTGGKYTFSSEFQDSLPMILAKPNGPKRVAELYSLA